MLHIRLEFIPLFAEFLGVAPEAISGPMEDWRFRKFK